MPDPVGQHLGRAVGGGGRELRRVGEVVERVEKPEVPRGVQLGEGLVGGVVGVGRGDNKVTTP